MINTNDVIDLYSNKIDLKEDEEEKKVIEINKNLRVTIDDLFKKTNTDEQLFEEEGEEEEEVNNQDDTEEVEEEEEEEDDDYNSINPTTTPIGKSCIDELILDLTNNSFDNTSNNNNNLIDSFLTSTTTLKEQQKYDETSSSSSSLATQTTISSPIQQQLKNPQIKSNIDDLLNLRPKTIKQPVQQPTIQINEIKTSPKKLIPIKLPTTTTTKVTYTPAPVPPSTTIASKINNKSRPQITQVVKNEQINKSTTIPTTINTNCNNKKTVIYKIESKDVKINTNEIIKPNINEDKQRITNINPLLTDHNTSLLTKLKPKSEPISPIVNQTSKFQTTVSSNIKQKSNDIPTAPATSSAAKVYTINDSLLNDVVKCVNKFNNYECYLKIAQKYSPIISKNVNKHNLPFCARSLNEYFSWPCAKRRATEWMRALNIKQRANSMIIKSVSKQKYYQKILNSFFSLKIKEIIK
jgi:hypothetical protein